MAKVPSKSHKMKPEKNASFSGIVCHALARGVVHFVLSANLRDYFLNGQNLSKSHEKFPFSNFGS